MSHSYLEPIIKNIYDKLNESHSYLSLSVEKLYNTYELGLYSLGYYMCQIKCESFLLRT